MRRVIGHYECNIHFESSLFFCCFLLLSVLHDRSLIFKVYNVTVQQVYKELLNGELFWRYSLTVDGVEIGFELNKDGKQFNKMALKT